LNFALGILLSVTGERVVVVCPIGGEMEVCERYLGSDRLRKVERGSVNCAERRGEEMDP
jgi:hypothetical protein